MREQNEQDIKTVDRLFCIKEIPKASEISCGLVNYLHGSFTGYCSKNFLLDISSLALEKHLHFLLSTESIFHCKVVKKKKKKIKSKKKKYYTEYPKGEVYL